MRVATFNLCSGRSTSHPGVDPADLERAVADLDADVVALQEVDRDQPRSGHADQAALAARAMGAVAHRFVATVHGTPGESWTPATGDPLADPTADPRAGASYGVALLSRHPVTAWRVLRLTGSRVVIPLPVPDPETGRLRPLLVRDEPRAALLATVESPLGPVTVACTHLSFVPWAARRQLEVVVRALREEPGPVVLLGDLNLGAGAVERLTGLRAAGDAPTHPVHAPRRRLDHVLIGPGLRVVGTRTARLAVSDHRAVVADLARAPA